MFAQLDWQLVPDSDGVQRTTFGIDPHNSSMRPSRLIGIVERHAAIAPIHAWDRIVISTTFASVSCHSGEDTNGADNIAPNMYASPTR